MPRDKFCLFPLDFFFVDNMLLSNAALRRYTKYTQD